MENKIKPRIDNNLIVKEEVWYLFPFYFIHDLWLNLRNKLYYFFHLEPAKSWKIGDKGDVILVQGLNNRWISLKTIGTEIHKWGYRVHIIKKLKKNLKPIIKGAADIAEYIKTNDLKNVILIGHSKGALNSIFLLKNHDTAEKIKKLSLLLVLLTVLHYLNLIP